MAVDPRKRSRVLLEGTDRAAARAMMKAVGFSDEDLRRPQIGVAHSWIGTMPCNWNHRKLAEKVMQGIRAAGDFYAAMMRASRGVSWAANRAEARP